MSFVVLLLILVFLVAINLFLWKSGFLRDAEKPASVIDRAVVDPNERKAFMKRLRRWKEEGRLTREEFEKIYALCRSDWDGATETPSNPAKPA